MRYFDNIVDTVGNTPLVRIDKHNTKAKIYGKTEFFNPGGSIKDRVALAMIKDAEDKGILKKGGVIIESTSGNTGIGLAAIGKAKGYKIVLTMPESMSEERKSILRAYGADLILTAAGEGMNGAVEKAKELKKEIPGSIIAGQFTNPVCADVHYKTTGPEIYEALDGKVDALVVGIGTGGTISGAGKYLKEMNKAIKVIAIEPFNSPLLSEGKSGPHGIQGIGANFIPQILDVSIYDEILQAKEENAYFHGRKVAEEEGLFVGISSGAAIWGAKELSKRKEFENKNIVAVLPDTGMRYLSTKMFK
ncbi:MAG TPA: cysteine synthase A [Anaerovoracaceae bacterium]|nr:cysteine synthase A [Anaerovoracaceae bacterium]